MHNDVGVNEEGRGSKGKSSEDLEAPQSFPHLTPYQLWKLQGLRRAVFVHFLKFCIVRCTFK